MKPQDDALLDVIYGAIANPESWPDVLTRTSDHLGAIGGLITQVPKRGRPLTVMGRLSPESLETYHKHYQWNLWSEAMRSAPSGKAVAVNSLTELGAIRKTGFYTDVLAPQRIVDAVQFSHQSMRLGGGVGGFGFMLSARGADSIDESLRRLQRLVPHLGRALDVTMRLGDLEDGTRQLGRVLQLLPTPALLLNGSGCITLANPAAEALISSGDGLRAERNGGLRLAAALPTETNALHRALRLSLAVALGAGKELGYPLRLTRPSGAAPLLVLSVPLPPPAFVFWEMLPQARVLVLILDPSTRSRASVDAVQVTFGLTPAEARVAVLIGSGLSGPEAAALLGISPATVKTHLKQCFEKCGVHSQVALARVLGSLPTDLRGLGA